MLVEDIIVEMPQKVLPTNFGLRNITNNVNTGVQLLKKNTKTISEDDDHILFRTGDMTGYFVYINKHNRMILYYNNYKEQNKKLTGKTVTQIAVWRDDRFRETVDIPKRVFYDVLLTGWPTIMSDSLQTDEGFEFWGRRMKEANERGLKVGYADFNDKSVEWFEGPETFNQWMLDIDLFGSEEKYQAIRMLISKA